jgi:hypothetical protein
MRGAIKSLVPAILIGLTACLPNPESPTLDPPGTIEEPGEPGDPDTFDSNFNSIQINGDFSGISWEPTDARNNLSLIDDNLWQIWASVENSDFADNNLTFKFTHDGAWAPDNFGAGDTPGQAVLEGNPTDINLDFPGPRGFYAFWLNDETLQYSFEPDIAEGTLNGTFSFEGVDPGPVGLTLWATGGQFDVELWSITATGSFEFGELADSLYTVVATAPGYGTVTQENIRVEDGSSENVLFEFTGGSDDSAMPDQPWATPIIDGTLEGDWTEVYDDGGHLGLWNLVNMDYDALHASWDGDSLYLAVSGDFAGTYNSLNIYIDADYGEGSGLSDLSLIQGEDDYAPVINRLNKLVDFAAVPEFGAEFATSTWGHVDLELSSLAADGTALTLGRGAIAASEDALELSIPWSLLYPGLGGDGVVPPFAQIAIFALIGSNSDSAMSDDSLPLVDDLNAPDAVVVIPIDEDGE